MLQEVQLEDGSALTVPGIVPKLSRTPGSQRTKAPNLGQDTNRILSEMGLSAAQIEDLHARGIVGGKE
jgi:formyl-CoA transferase